MKINSLIPMLWVEDLKLTIDYYSRVLNFIVVSYSEDWGWAAVKRDDVEIMFSKFNDHVADKKPHFTGTLYLNTNDVDQWWQLLSDKAEIFYPIEDFEYGMREFAIKDCNGYILQFGQALQ